MLKAHLHRFPNGNFTSYQEAISHMAANTVVYYNGLPILPNGVDRPSYDISQVRCWLSEQPLRNGMRLCTINNGSARIALIEEPAKEKEGEMNVDVNVELPLNPNNLLLISPDCYEGLKLSLEYLNQHINQQLIKNPHSPNEPVSDPLNPDHYIWPNYVYYSTRYSSNDCFIYSRKTVVVREMATPEPENATDEDNDGSDDNMVIDPEPSIMMEVLKEFLLVEANPELPGDLFVMAENTIRLFRLNSCFYDHLNDAAFDVIKYNANKSEIAYDDMRLEGRMQAYDRARKSLQQLKTMQNLVIDAETSRLFISQYKILMELTGYFSVWATVFNEGGNSGDFNDIIGTPAPVVPVTPVSPVTPVNPNTPPPVDDGGKSRKRKRMQIVKVTDVEKLGRILEKALTQVVKQEMLNKILETINMVRLQQNIDYAAMDDAIWESLTKKRLKTEVPRQAKNNQAAFTTIVDGVVKCGDEEMTDLVGNLSQTNVICNS